MTDDAQDEERVDRDHERSAEAHWQVAEAGAEDDERSPNLPARPTTGKGDRENEGGALDRDPKQPTS